MTEATPRPWAADPDYRAGMSWNVHIVQEENPDTRIAFMSNTPNSGTAQANAALIVKAVNLHADLVAALRKASDVLNWVGDPADDGQSPEAALLRNNRLVEQAQAVIDDALTKVDAT